MAWTGTKDHGTCLAFFVLTQPAVRRYVLFGRDDFKPHGARIERGRRQR